MSSEDFVRYYGKNLSPYEREEVMDYDMVYYANFN